MTIYHMLWQAVDFADSRNGKIPLPLAIFATTLGNLTALLAARQAKAGYDVWAEGQREPMSVLVSNQAHYCVARAVQCMGWGQKGAATVETDDRFRLRPEALEGALRRSHGKLPETEPYSIQALEGCRLVSGAAPTRPPTAMAA